MAHFIALEFGVLWEVFDRYQLLIIQISRLVTSAVPNHHFDPRFISLSRDNLEFPPALES